MDGSAILVHGGWGSPADWQWVIEHLERRGINALAVDLPSHRDASSDRRADADEVRAVAMAAAAPVVLAGWSYGTGVISDAIRPEDESIAGLVYVSSVPRPVTPDPGDEPPAGELDLSMIRFFDDGTQVLDDELWLEGGDVITCPPDVMVHLRENPRRPFPVTAALDPIEGEPWREIPTVTLLGRSDALVPPALQDWAVANLSDVRLVDGDHFLIWRAPDQVADAIVSLIHAFQQPPD